MLKHIKPTHVTPQQHPYRVAPPDNGPAPDTFTIEVDIVDENNPPAGTMNPDVASTGVASPEEDATITFDPEVLPEPDGAYNLPSEVHNDNPETAEIQILWVEQ